jgi:flagellar motor switch protein FliN
MNTEGTLDRSEDFTAMAPVGGSLAGGKEPPLAPLTEVPLEVQVRLGSARLSLGELLKLRPGQVVGLNRDLSDPAEIMVGNKVIALGQVVLVGQELGVRVTGLPAPEGNHP